MASRLTEIASQHTSPQIEITIVHIPNITYGKRSTSSAATVWSEVLPEIIEGNAKVFQFEHGLTIEDSFAWSDVFDQGVLLLNKLHGLPSFQTQSLYPLVFITEGLGGLVLKNALVIANRQPKRYRRLLESVFGLILIGVPHIRGTGDETLQRLITLLRPGLSKVSKKSISKDHISRLELLSESFREIDLPLPKGLISGYETLATALASGTLSIRKTAAILVGRDFAKIEWPRELEQLIPIDVRLEEVLKPIPQSNFRSQLIAYILEVTNTVSTNIKAMRADEATVTTDTPHLPLDSTTSTSSSSSHAPHSALSALTAGLQSTSLVPRQTPPARTLSPPMTTPSMLSQSFDSDSSYEILPGAAQFDAPVKKSPFPCYLTKPHTRNRRFWPREDIMSAVERALLPSSDSNPPETTDTLRTFVLHGLGGVGKTEIATEFVFRHMQKFDAVFFLHADDRGHLSRELSQVAETLNLDTGTDIDSVKYAVREWLANPIKEGIQPQKPRSSRLPNILERSHMDTARWLIVFDNADDPEVLLEFWPEDGCGSVLVTSRDPMAKDPYYFGKEGLEVRELSVDDGAAFLRSMTGNEHAAEAMEASRSVSTQLNGLPLAIEQIGAIIRRNSLSIAGFLSVYKDDEDLESLHGVRIAKGRGYEYSIAGVWALQDLPAGSVALLSLISFLDPDCIHRRLLREHMAVIGIDGFPSSEVEFQRALTRLFQSSIVSSSLDGTELRVHRLVQDVVRARMRSSGTLEANFDQVVNLLWTDFPRVTRGGVGRAHKVGRWDRCQELHPHISRLREFYVKYTGDRSLFRSERNLADLLNEAGWYQHERMNPTETIPVTDLAVEICERRPDDYKEQMAINLSTRIWNTALLKKWEETFTHASHRLELEQELYAKTGVITSALVAGYNDKAAAYSMNGLPSKAFPLLDESRRLREAMPTFKPEHNFSPFHERSLAHYRLGQYDDAMYCLTRALRERIAALGENDRQSVRTGLLYYALGNVRLAQGAANPSLLVQSSVWHQKALVHFRATAGDNHYRTACACYRVAEHYIRNRNFVAGRQSLKQALKVFQGRLYYRQEFARTCFLFYELCMAEGHEDEANVMLDQSVGAFNAEFPQFKRTSKDITREDFESLGTYDF